MCMTCNVSFDQTKADGFASKLLSHLNASAVMLMTSLGHRTGLFDAMSDGDGYTSVSLASKAKLSERYVREWLGAMVTGGIVDYDPEAQTYVLPGEHAAYLTRAASPNNIAVVAQYIGVLGAAEDAVAEAFRHGRGVPYSAYPRFHDVMAEDSGQTALGGLYENVIPAVPGLQSRLEKGIEVVDVGCGAGLVLTSLAERFPNSRFTGLDLSPEMTAKANARAKQRGLTNLRFIECDLSQWGAVAQYDLVTAFDAIHDQGRPDLVLGHIRRALRPGGTFLMQDIKASSDVSQNHDLPLSAFIYTISCMHCMSVSLAQGGMGLGAAWGKELALSMLRDAGFAHTNVTELPHDFQNYYYISNV